MPTFEAVKHKLNRAHKLKDYLFKLEERIQVSRAKAEKVTPAYSANPSSGGTSQSKVEDNVILIEELEELTADSRREYREALQCNIDVISQVPDYLQRVVLEEHAS